MIVPAYWPKNVPFNVLPPDTYRVYPKDIVNAIWALYYSPSCNASYVVIDVQHGYRIHTYLGKVELSYIQQAMGGHISRMQNSGCCSDS